MKTAATALAGLVLAFTMTACGGSDDPEADVRKELKDVGLSESVTDCAIKEIKSDAGSLDKFKKLDASEQSTMAAKAGSTCSKDMSKDDLGELADTLEDQDVDLNNPTFRKSYITGMTTQGVPEELANCIVDKAIDQKLKATDLIDAQTIQKLAAACD